MRWFRRRRGGSVVADTLRRLPVAANACGTAHNVGFVTMREGRTMAPMLSERRAGSATTDGRSITLRPVTPADAGGLMDLHARCSERARYFRFHAAKPRLRPAEAEYLAAADGEARVAFVATIGDGADEYIVADGRFDFVGDGDAEAALLVQDEVQGLGLGATLLGQLLAVAGGIGVRRVLLDILPENRPMLALAARFDAEPI